MGLAASAAILATAGLGLAGTANAAPASHSVRAASARPADFTGIGFERDNIKIEGFDHGCLTYAHPVAGSQVATAPCNGGHNWDYILSPDGSQAVFKAFGTSLALADSGGRIVLEPYNQTSDSLALSTVVTDGNGTGFTETAFAENHSIWVMATGISGNVVPSGVKNVHDAWVPLGG